MPGAHRSRADDDPTPHAAQREVDLRKGRLHEGIINTGDCVGSHRCLAERVRRERGRSEATGAGLQPRTGQLSEDSGSLVTATIVACGRGRASSSPLGEGCYNATERSPADEVAVTEAQR
jgi:hypothetical protein